MKKLLATTALTLVALSGAASAQSVLERVLNSINTGNTNMLPVTGTFANIAENVAVIAPVSTTVYVDETGDDIITAEDYAAINFTSEYAAVPAGSYYTNAAGEIITAAEYNALPISDTSLWTASTATSGANPVYSGPDGLVTVATYGTFETSDPYTAMTVEGGSQILNQINGSISNTMVGIKTATADVGSVNAMEEVTVDIGDLSTTVLGSVNTGEITLGVNQDVSEALAGSSSAVAATIQQLGGVADQTALVLNVSSNATDVIGSVSNSFDSLNGSIGNIATTVLGAVNTGTITSGVNAAVNGVQAGIIGN